MNIDLTNPAGFALLDPTIFPGNVIIGTGAADVDYTLTFDGDDNDGVITFDEGANRFDFSSSMKVPDDKTIYLGSGASDGQLVFTGATSLLTLINYAGDLLFGGSDDTYFHCGFAKKIFFQVGGITKGVIAGNAFETDWNGGLGRVCNSIRLAVGNSPYDILVTQEIIFYNTDGGDSIVHLPILDDGTHYKIINTGSSGNDLTVKAFDEADGTNKIFGANFIVLLDGENVDIHAQETEGWW